MLSAGRAVRCCILGFLLLPLLLAGCATGENVVEAPVGLREGHVTLSEGQEASFVRAPHPGLLRVWDDFEERVAVGESFVVSDSPKENRYLRITEGDQTHLTVVPPYPDEGPGVPDSRLRDFRLLFELRLPAAGENWVYVTGRRREGSEVGVTLAVSNGWFQLLEGVPGAERLLEEKAVTDESATRWREVELRLLGSEALLLIDGEVQLRSDSLEWLQAGGVELSCHGSADIDNLRLYSMEETQESNGSALLIEELQDDFSSGELAPWWQTDGNGSVEVGLTGGGARLFGSESYQTVSGIRSKALIPSEGRVRVEFYDPPERTQLALAIAKPTVGDSLVFAVDDLSVSVVRHNQGSGTQLQRRTLPPGAWSPGGTQELELIIAEGSVYGNLNGTPILAYQSRPEMLRGTLFAGYLGHYSRDEGRTIRSVELQSGLSSGFEPDAYPSAGEEGPQGELTLPSFEKPRALFATFDRSGDPQFGVGANKSSVATAEVVSDEATGNGYLSLEFTMREGNGLHALASFGLEKDLSEYGGIAFRARGEGIERAHVSLNEIAPGAMGDRIDAFFPVTTEWREYRLPFTPEYFAPNSDSLLRGADGVFDFAHTGWMLFEVYGYQGRGALHIDEVRFLPGRAKSRFTDRVTVDDFEPEDRLTPFGLEAHSDTDGGAVAEYKEVSGRGARGSDGFGRLLVEKGADDHVELVYWGGIPAGEHQGFGFAARGAGVTSTVVNLHEIEEESSPLFRTGESHSCTIPLNQEWVEWRFPFIPGAMRPSRYSDLTDGRLNGWFVEGISYTFPHGFEAQGAELYLDEFFLFDAEKEKSRRVGLFNSSPEAGDDLRITGVIDSVFRLNLERLQGYELRSGLDAESRERAFGVASEEDLDFFLRPVYEIEGERMALSLELCNVPAKAVTKVIDAETVVGLDIFHDLDLLSREVLNILADTNLAFEDHLTRTEEGGSTIWADSLERIEPYWLFFDGVEAQVQDGLRLSSAFPRERALRTERPMLLSEAYLSGVQSISLELTDGAAILWNYRGRNALSSVELDGTELRADINGIVTYFRLPAVEDGDGRWRSLSLDAVDSGYRLVLDGETLGTAPGYEVHFGRLGLALASGEPSFRNLSVRFAE